ncbi:MAG: DUF4040 domain-containing protein [Pseudomonadota bacterium]
METVITITLFILLVAVAVAIVRTRLLFAVVMLSGLFSLICALLFIALDAVDVAFTEAAVGAGISTVLMLGTMALTSRREKPRPRSAIPLLVVVITGAVLVYGTLDMPNFGSPDAPAFNHVAPHYLERIPREIDVPNTVTAILASYRGFDTLGEVVVVFTAGLGVVLLLSGLGRGRRQSDAASEEDG